MEHLISIGQFAAASRLSWTAVRLYDENGLLPPARVDPVSGYRSSRLDQPALGNADRAPSERRHALVEIRRVLDDPT